MRRRALLPLLVALVAVAGHADAGVLAARLEVVSGPVPLIVSGSGFRPGERVVLTSLALDGRRTSEARAGQSGRFRARVRTSAAPCLRPFAVRARGAGGSLALLRLPVQACVPPPVD